MNDNPFLTKIIYEKQLCENERYGIVPDMEPMVPGHYLFYLKDYLPAVADSNIPETVRFIEKIFPQYAGKQYAYFERGRASFCTSMNGVIHGHGHLVPTFLDNMCSFFPYGTVYKYPDMETAYRNVPQTGQYLIWGNLKGCFFVLQDVKELPKRTIRHTVEKYHNVEIN